MRFAAPLTVAVRRRDLPCGPPGNGTYRAVSVRQIRTFPGTIVSVIGETVGTVEVVGFWR
jgi:hypothetical protein